MMYPILLSFVITLLLLFLLTRTSLASIALDHPNARSLHTKLTPRTGGFAMMSGIIGAWIVLFLSYNSMQLIWIFLLALLVFISVLDDVKGLPIKLRLLVQVVVVLIFLFQFSPENWWGVALLTLLLVWVTNLYNFMDGADGLAGGMAFFGFSAYAYTGYLNNYPVIMLMCICVAVPSLIFLFFNFHPAKIFMGDAGSIPIGFLAGAVGYYGWLQGVWPAWFPILVFSPFIVDATTTLLKRLFNGENIAQAHRSHYYQRLVQLGWGHSKTAYAEYLLMLSVSGSSILLLDKSTAVVCSGLLCWILIFIFIMYRVDKAWSLNQKELA